MIFNKSCVLISGEQKLIDKLLQEKVIMDFVVKRKDGSYLFSWYDFSYRLTKINNCTNLLSRLSVKEYYYAGKYKGEEVDFIFTDVGVVGILNTTTDTKNHKVYYHKIQSAWFTVSENRGPIKISTIEKEVKSNRINWSESFKTVSDLRTLSWIQKEVLIRRYWDFLDEKEKEDVWAGSDMEKKFGSLEELRQIYNDL